jgi:hypothetical protein
MSLNGASASEAGSGRSEPQPAALL